MPRAEVGQRPRPNDIREVVQLGFRMGPALLGARRRWEREQRTPAGTTGRRYRPHQKRGHYKTYWTGRGRQVPKVRWIAPHWVSQDMPGDEAPPCTVEANRVVFV